MKITKRQLRRIIQEVRPRVTPVASTGVDFDWTPDGLSMIMYVDGNKVMSFSSQRDVQQLITRLQELIDGPMRTSP